MTPGKHVWRVVFRMVLWGAQAAMSIEHGVIFARTYCIVCMYVVVVVVRYNVEIVFGCCVERVSGFGCVISSHSLHFIRGYTAKKFNIVCCVCWLLALKIPTNQRQIVIPNCDEFFPPSSNKYDQSLSQKIYYVFLIFFSCVFWFENIRRMW